MFMLLYMFKSKNFSSHEYSSLALEQNQGGYGMVFSSTDINVYIQGKDETYD